MVSLVIGKIFQKLIEFHMFNFAMLTTQIIVFLQ
jgi:hypothetical protein